MDPGFPGKIIDYKPSGKGAEIQFAGCAPEDVAVLAQRFLDAEGLKLESGTIWQGEWGSGSTIGRALAGGFVKRRKFNVSIAPPVDGGVQLRMMSAMSGVSGSLFGILRERKQRRQFVSKLKLYMA